ncbi:MAG: amidohydrolase family protein, partial [Myxococcota bacterium]
GVDIVAGLSTDRFALSAPDRDHRQKVLEAARQLDMQVVPEGGATFMHNLTMIADGHTTIEHNLPVESIYDDVLQFWAKSDTAITPTLVVSYGGLSGELYWYEKMDVWRHRRLRTFVPRYVLDPRARRRQKAPEGDYNHIRVSEGLKKLVDRGHWVNTGAHGQLDGLAEHWEMWMFEQGGMTPLEVLRSATLNPARTLGMDRDLGSLEPGKLADLVVLDQNPLENIRNTDSVRLVMQNGRLYDATTLDQVGNHPDQVGSQAFGEGAQSLGIGRWWGGHTHQGAHGRCGCGAGHN